MYSHCACTATATAATTGVLLQGANGYSNTDHSASSRALVDHPTTSILRNGASSTALTAASSAAPLFPETPCPTDVDEQLLHKVSSNVVYVSIHSSTCLLDVSP
jgi:hypothetical protein